jgi:hypothetical protein
MAIIYNWVVSSMDEYPTTPDNLVDVVFKVHWRRVATEEVDGKIYTANTFSVLEVPSPSPEDFTPYPDLTFDQVCGWLDAGLDVAAIDASLAIQIENEINPPVVSLPLPWVTPEPTPEPEPEVEETPEIEE